MTHDVPWTPVHDPVLVHEAREIMRVKQDVAAPRQMFAQALQGPTAEHVAEGARRSRDRLLKTRDVLRGDLGRPTRSRLVRQRLKPTFVEVAHHQKDAGC